MTTRILIFNLSLLAVEVALLLALRRSKGTGMQAALVQPVVAFVLAVLLGGGIFGLMGLLAYGIFLHTPLMFIATSVVAPKKSKPIMLGSMAVALAIVAIGVDAFLIEPKALQVSRVSLTSSKVTKALRIVLLADLQTDKFGDYERNALQMALAEKPDLIAFAGDYLQVQDQEQLSRLRIQITQYLIDIGFKARLGVFAVPGNVDPPEWEESFSAAGGAVFVKTHSVDTGEVVVTGLTLGDSFDATLRIPAQERFHIVLGHAPDFSLGSIDADLLLAGHTHGGQVVIPGFGPLITFSRVPRSWASGVTTLAGGRTLIVSRGIGMERGDAPRLRFLCRPEIVVIDVAPLAAQ